MAQNTVYKWPVVNLQAVCKTQNANAGDELILDGTMAEIGSAEISFIRTRVSRSVSITSTDDLSGVNFTVTGMQNGGRVTKDNITGPNNTTIYIDEVFDTITSVSVDGNVTNVQVGTGTKGFLPLISANPNFSVLNIRNTNGLYALSVIPFNGANIANNDGITYTILNTLENIQNNGKSLLSQLPRLFEFQGMSNKRDKQLIQNINLTNYILVQINATATPNTDTLEAIYMQS